MAEDRELPPVSMEQARAWVGRPVDDLNGAGAGLLHGFFVDADDGEPSWLIVKQGRFKSVLVAAPFADCAATGSRVWVAQERERMRNAPVVDPTRPLLREHELTIGSHYGIGSSVGRPLAVSSRDESSVTSRPV